MQKLSKLFFYTLVVIAFSSCRYNDNDIHISYNESGQYYSMQAYFPRSATKEVDEYMDDKIGRNSNMSFVNSRIDGNISLDNHTNFYIKKYPGVLEIKLDKSKNTNEAYRTIKWMCQGIKKVLTNK